jgi:trimeric autotransporter adhesin
MAEHERKIMKNIHALRNSRNRSSRRRGSILIPLGLVALLAILPKVQAIIPPPDGGYPGANTAEGDGALNSLNARGPARQNTALGFHTLYNLTTGLANTAVGAGALLSNTTGNNNTAVGDQALSTNTTSGNTAVGFQALTGNTGAYNTATGSAALLVNGGGGNVAIGAGALQTNFGDNNVAIGGGTFGGVANYGDGNVAIGYLALYANNNQGNDNTAIGRLTLYNNTTGGANIAVGDGALYFNDTGDFSTALGSGALFNNTSGRGNTALGALAGVDVTTADYVIAIGAAGANVSNSCYIGNIWNQSGGSQAVYVNSEGKLGAQVSSRRFKDEIQPIEQASKVIYGLKPVSFHYKKEIEPTRPLGFGLIAEEVEKISPDLVIRDKEGKPYSVRYDAVNAMLLNEFLKEHRKVEELKSTAANQEATIAQHQKSFEKQEKQIEALASGLQKVSAQLEMTRPAPQQVVLNIP